MMKNKKFGALLKLNMPLILAIGGNSERIGFVG